jgi:ankyrin repeat protein
MALTYFQYLKKPDVVCNFNVFDGQKATALCYAARYGTFEVVKNLLQLGADPNFNAPQYIPLIEAITHNSDFQVIAGIMSRGAHIDAQDAQGNTALHAAIISEKGRVIQYLLQHGANCELTNARKQTPLHLAVDVTSKKQTYRSFTGERLLIQAGANVNATDIFGKPLIYTLVF